MPYMNGVELYLELRRNPRWWSIPFIFITADDLALSPGTDPALDDAECLIKPVDILKLLELITSRLHAGNGVDHADPDRQ